MQKALLSITILFLALFFVACNDGSNDNEKKTSTKTITLNYFAKSEKDDKASPITAKANVSYNDDGIQTSTNDTIALAQLIIAVTEIKNPITETSNSETYTYKAVAVGTPKESNSIKGTSKN